MELEVAEVVLADAELKNFIDDGEQVMERSNRLKRDGIGRAKDSARGSQDESVFDCSDRYTAVVEGSRKQTILATDSAGCSWCAAIGVEDFADVIVFGDVHDIQP